jgi:hypothetical protein
MTEQQKQAWEIALGLLLMWAFGFAAGLVLGYLLGRLLPILINAL